MLEDGTEGLLKAFCPVSPRRQATDEAEILSAANDAA